MGVVAHGVVHPLVPVGVLGDVVALVVPVVLAKLVDGFF